MGLLLSGKRSSIWSGEGEGAFHLEAPFALYSQRREHKKIPVLGGGRGLAPQSLEGCPSTQDKNRGSLHIGQWKGSLKERYGNTKATVEHNTMG